MRFEAWIAPAMVFFQLSLWALAAALVAAAWMLLPATPARAVSVFMAFMVAGSLWALRPPICLGYYMLFRQKGTSDTLHWTLQGSWGLNGIHIVSRSAMVRILLSCGADVNAAQNGSLPLSPLAQDAQKRSQLEQLCQLASQDGGGQLSLDLLQQIVQPAPRLKWWQLWARLPRTQLCLCGRR